jgi:mannose-1-phosphate guanylyltransferase
MMQRFAPRVYHGLHKIKEGTHGKRLTTLTPGVRRILQREYKKMPNISIDHAVLEKAGSKGKVLTMEAKFPWSDLGSWAALHKFLPKDKNGNAAMGQWLGIDSRGCLVYSRNRLVVLIGMQGVTVVDTPDALLVGDINRAQDIREAVSRLERYGHGKLVK